jgi:hypothetical protein
MIGYKDPTSPPTNQSGNKASESNEKSMNSILCGLSKSEFVEVMHCESEK